MQHDHESILKRANAAALEGDAESFLALCTDDTVWTFVGDRVLRGKVAVREWMKEAYKPPPRFSVFRMVADGDFLTAIGEILQRDHNGEEVLHAYCDVWRFRNGQLSELHAFVVKGGLVRDAFA